MSCLFPSLSTGRVPRDTQVCIAFPLWLFIAKGKSSPLVIAPLFVQWRAVRKGPNCPHYLI